MEWKPANERVGLPGRAGLGSFYWYFFRTYSTVPLVSSRGDAGGGRIAKSSAQETGANGVRSPRTLAGPPPAGRVSSSRAVTFLPSFLPIE